MNKDYLFHLAEINHDFEGYYIDADLKNIYSTRTGPLRVLTKTKPASTRCWYWHLYNRRLGRSEAYNTEKFRKDVSLSTEYIEWRSELNRSRVDTGSSDRVFGGYILAMVTTDGVLSYSKTPKVHSTEAEARAEAERLAKKNVGVIFVVTKITGSVVAGGVTWS